MVITILVETAAIASKLYAQTEAAIRALRVQFRH
jgi:hypothetical protein